MKRDAEKFINRLINNLMRNSDIKKIQLGCV